MGLGLVTLPQWYCAAPFFTSCGKHFRACLNTAPHGEATHSHSLSLSLSLSLFVCISLSLISSSSSSSSLSLLIWQICLTWPKNKDHLSQLYVEYSLKTFRKQLKMIITIWNDIIKHFFNSFLHLKNKIITINVMISQCIFFNVK